MGDVVTIEIDGTVPAERLVKVIQALTAAGEAVRVEAKAAPGWHVTPTFPTPPVVTPAAPWTPYRIGDPYPGDGVWVTYDSTAAP